MKKISIGSGLLYILLGVLPGLADSVQNQNNFSVQFQQMFARYATIEVDAAAFNPAGTAKMKDGLYISVAETGAVDNTHATGGADGKGYDMQAVYPVVPAVQVVYKVADIAGYLNYGIPSGGGVNNYKNGSPGATAALVFLENGINEKINALYPGILAIFSNNKSTLKGSAVIQGIDFGAAYCLNELIAVSVGGRYIYAVKSSGSHMEFDYSLFGNGHGNFDMEYEQKAQGFGGTLGLNISPNKNLNVGFKYETVTKLEYKTTYKTAPNFNSTGIINTLGYDQQVQAMITALLPADGSKSRSDLPHWFSLGAQYQFTPELMVAIAGTYYLQRGAKWDGNEKNYNNSYEGAIGLEYAIMPKLKFRCGFAYCDVGNWKRGTTTVAMVESAAHDQAIVGTGVEYEAIPNLVLNIAYTFQAFLETKNDSTGDKKYTNRNGWGFSVGYKFF